MTPTVRYWEQPRDHTLDSPAAPASFRLRGHRTEKVPRAAWIQPLTGASRGLSSGARQTASRAGGAETRGRARTHTHARICMCTCSLEHAQTHIQMDMHAHAYSHHIPVHTCTHTPTATVYPCTHARIRCTSSQELLDAPPSPPHTPGATHDAQSSAPRSRSRRRTEPALGTRQRGTELTWRTQGPARRRSLRCEKPQNPIAGVCSDTELSLPGPPWTLGEGEVMSA